jgi:hypothetical protein
MPYAAGHTWEPVQLCRYGALLFGARSIEQYNRGDSRRAKRSPEFKLIGSIDSDG